MKAETEKHAGKSGETDSKPADKVVEQIEKKTGAEKPTEKPVEQKETGEKPEEKGSAESMLLQMIKSRISEAGFTDEYIVDIQKAIDEYEAISIQVQELVAKRQPLYNKLMDFLQRIKEHTEIQPIVAMLIDIEKLKKLIKAEVSGKKKKGSKGRRMGKKIFVDGIEYNSAKAACDALEIEVGGDSPVRKLLSFAKNNDYMIVIDGIPEPEDSTLSDIYAKLGNATEIRINTA